jgi:hypothetical protein
MKLFNALALLAASALTAQSTLAQTAWGNLSDGTNPIVQCPGAVGTCGTPMSGGHWEVVPCPSGHGICVAWVKEFNVLRGDVTPLSRPTPRGTALYSVRELILATRPRDPVLSDSLRAVLGEIELQRFEGAESELYDLRESLSRLFRGDYLDITDYNRTVVAERRLERRVGGLLETIERSTAGDSKLRADAVATFGRIVSDLEEIHALLATIDHHLQGS